MKTILLTTDLSPESKIAFATSLEFVKNYSAKLLLLAVIEDLSQAAMVYAMDFPVLPDPDIQKQLMQKVESELKEIKTTYFSSIPCETFAVEARGPVHAEIIRFAKQHQADLIVIATHGRTGISRILIGSVAEKVVREAHCPVLTIPAKASTP